MATQYSPVWFITGAATGLGRAFAEYAIEKNYRVVATALSVESIQSMQKGNPDRVLAAKLDITIAGDIHNSLRAAIERFGRINVLMNNAGYALVGAVEETTDEQVRAQLNVNMFGTVALSRAVLPIMRAQQSGAIVQISSVVGSYEFPAFGAYSASKYALEGISEALQAEVAPFGIKVLIVQPGAFRTALTSGSGPVTESIGVYEQTPAGTMKDIVRAMHNTQPGDPARAAEAVDTALQAVHPPLRLLLGNDAADMVPERVSKQLQEFAEWDSLARSTDYRSSSKCTDAAALGEVRAKAAMAGTPPCSTTRPRA